MSTFELFIFTRSYAANRAADLDWIVRPGYSSGRYILGENHENQPGTMKTTKNQPGTMKNQPGIMKNHENRPGTMKDHENQPGTMKNQPRTMNNHENPPGTIKIDQE